MCKHNTRLNPTKTKTFSIALAIFMTLLCSAAMAQEPKPQPAYPELLGKVKNGDHSVNFKDLRMAFTETKEYSPYGADREGRKAMFAALKAEKYDECIKQADTILGRNFVDINGQFGAFACHQRLGNGQKADLHKWIFLELINSITDSGDGKSPETAMVVISTDEEYAWFNFMQMKVTNQALLNDKGHHYDKMTAVSEKAPTPTEYFFNVDKPYNWLGSSLKN